MRTILLICLFFYACGLNNSTKVTINDENNNTVIKGNFNWPENSSMDGSTLYLLKPSKPRSRGHAVRTYCQNTEQTQL
jgi:hypothetical protein